MLENFLNTKAKAFIIFIFSAISLGVFILSTLISVNLFSKWYGIIASVILMVLAIPFHIAGRKFNVLYLIGFFINSIANGCSVSAYYVTKNISFTLYELLISALPALVILLLVYLSLQIYSKTKRFSISISIALISILMIITIIFWIKTNSVFFSFGFFSLLIALFYLGVFGISINHDERAVIRDVSYGSFGSFVMLTVIVIVILSEGCVLDGLDIGGEGKPKNKSK